MVDGETDVGHIVNGEEHKTKQRKTTINESKRQKNG
jgi:hypothetical protein